MLTTQHSLFEVNESDKNAYFLRTNKHAKIKSTQRKKKRTNDIHTTQPNLNLSETEFIDSQHKTFYVWCL